RRRYLRQLSVVLPVGLHLLTQQLPFIRRRSYVTVEQLSDLPGLGEVMSPRVLLQSRTVRVPGLLETVELLIPLPCEIHRLVQCPEANSRKVDVDEIQRLLRAVLDTVLGKEPVQVHLPQTNSVLVS